MTKGPLLQQALKFFIVPAGIGTMITTICLTNISKPLYKLEKLNLEQEPPALTEEPLTPIYVAPGGKGDGKSKTGSGGQTTPGSSGDNQDGDVSTGDSADGEDEGSPEGNSDQNDDGEGGDRAVGGGDDDEPKKDDTAQDTEQDSQGKEDSEDTEGDSPEDTTENSDSPEDPSTDNEDTDDDNAGDDEEQEDTDSEGSSTPQGSDEGVENKILQGGTDQLEDILTGSIRRIISIDIDNASKRVYDLSTLVQQLEKVVAATEELEKKQQKAAANDSGAKDAGNTDKETGGNSGTDKASLTQ